MIWWFRRHIFCYRSPDSFFKELPATVDSTNGPSEDEFRFSTVEAIDLAFENCFRHAAVELGHRLPFTLATARARLRQGQRFIVIYSATDIAGWGWFALREARCDDLFSSIRIRPGQGYAHNIYVRTEYRGRELATRLLLAAEPQLRKDGLSAVWAMIYPWNIASQKAFIKAGYRKIGSYRYVNILGLKLHRRPSLIQATHASMLSVEP
jgi:ribosomal protein S18 acetylase RimI-like enzyme